MNILAEQSTHE